MTSAAYFVAAWLVAVGLYGIITSRHLVHLTVCISVLQSAAYLLLLAVGYRSPPAGAPIYSDVPPGTPSVDPTVHAMTLTDVVVGATVSALLLALTLQVHKHKGTVDPNELKPMRRS